MKKYFLTGLAVLSIALAFGQGNYMGGNITVTGPQWNAATTLAPSPIATQVAIRSGGVWFFGGIVNQRNSSNVALFDFDGTGTYLNATATTYVDGEATYSNSTANFTFPVGDASAAVPYHPLSVANLSLSSVGIHGGYYASATPNPTSLGTGVGSVDPSAYWNLYSNSAGLTGDVTAVVRDETATFPSAPMFLVGYGTGSTIWNKIGVNSATLTAQTLASNSGINLGSANSFKLTVGSTSVPGLLVSPKVFLQGAISGTLMTTGLHAVIPLSQPYGPVFGYTTGTETIASVPTNMTDWVLVDLKDPASPSTAPLYTRAALLMNDGTITDLDGVSPVSFTAPAGSYYVAIRHRNHLGVRSSITYSLNTTTALGPDFRAAQANAYQNTAITVNPAMKDLGNGYFAMYGGNGTGNNTTRASGPSNINDYLYLLNTVLGGVNTAVISGYSAGDYNMNGVSRASGPTSINDYLFLLNTVLGGDNTLVITQHN